MCVCLSVPFILIVYYAQTVRVSVIPHKIDIVRDIWKFLNHEGHQNCMFSLKVRVILITKSGFLQHLIFKGCFCYH